MGNILQCNSDQEAHDIIEGIYQSIPFNEVQSQNAYENFLKCLNNQAINPSESISSISSTKELIDIFNYNSYISQIVAIESNKCKLIHLEYFDNLRRLDNCVSIIATILINLSKGTKEEKTQLLTNNYKSCFNKVSKEIISDYINDLINANTSVCLYSFNSSFGAESTKKLSDVYSENRKRKLKEFIMSNYNHIYEKYYDKNNTPSSEIMRIDNGSNEKLMKDLFELIFSFLQGEFMRNWLYEEYEKDKPKMKYLGCF